MYHERLTAAQTPDVVGMDDVAVARALAPETGVIEAGGLLRPLEHPVCTCEGRYFVGLLELVDDHRSNGAGKAVPHGFVGSQTGPRLADEKDGDAERPGPLDQVDSGARSV